MGANPDDHNIPKVLVIRIEGGRKAFRWEIRVAGRGLPLSVGEGPFTSEKEAREAGEIVLEALPAYQRKRSRG